MNSSKTSLLACDVCDTLYKSNTTFDFLKFFLRKQAPFRFAILNCMTRKWSPLFYALMILGKLREVDLPRVLSLKLLNGYNLSAVEENAASFVKTFLRPRVNQKIVDLLLKEAANANIVLVSSSIAPVIKAISDEFGFPFYASALEHSEGILTGALTNDLTGKKHTIVNKIVKELGTKTLIVVTDNRSDYELVSMASERYIVISDDNHKKFWLALNPEFIHC
jgi:phosphoserine phosphatase